MRGCSGCCDQDEEDIGGDRKAVDDWRDDQKAMAVEEAPLLNNPRSTPPKRRYSDTTWRVCACICCALLIGLIGVSLYAFNCIQSTMAQDSIVLPLATKPGGGQFFSLQNMSHIPRNRWEAFTLLLREPWTTATNYTFGYASAEETPMMLFEGAQADGVFELIPEKLRGVWWMRGNPIPEVLAVMHYGQWFEEEKTLLMPNSPWTWAWWGGESSEYPEGLDSVSKLVYRFSSGKSIAESYTDATAIDTLVSFVFEQCPEDAACADTAGNLTYAKLMSHANGDLTKHGMVYYDGYTMEEMPAEEVTNVTQRDGALYFRRAELFCGLFGRGSGYNLTKILDGYGNKVEPYFSEYLKFMAGRPLIVWAGLPP